MTTGQYDEPYTGQQEAVFVSTRGRRAGNPAPAARPLAPPAQAQPPGLNVRAALAKERPEERYLRHIRNWVAFIGIVIAVMVTLTLIGAAVTVDHLSQVNNSSGSCLSEGGTDPSC